MNKNNNNSILPISSKYIRDCNNISLLLHKNGIMAQVSPNQTIEREENRYIINCGCKIVFTNNIYRYEQRDFVDMNLSINIMAKVRNATKNYKKRNDYYKSYKNLRRRELTGSYRNF